MSWRPYETAQKLDESLIFTADLPAFAPIGRRYAEVEDARLDFAYSPDVIGHWTKYMDAVQEATADAIAGRRPWPEIKAEMSQKFPNEFPPSLDRVPSRIWQNRVTPEGWKEYLECLAQNARLLQLSKLIYAPQSGWRNPRYAENVRAKRAELLPPGRYKFDCGNRLRLTENQKALFDRLESCQDGAVQEVARALREFYALCRGHGPESELSDPYVQILFPTDDSGNVPLDRFRIQSFVLHPSEDQIGLTFDSMFDWCEEHGCAVLISDGKVADDGSGWGGGEVLFPLYEELSRDDGDE